MVRASVPSQGVGGSSRFASGGHLRMTPTDGERVGIGGARPADSECPGTVADTRPVAGEIVKFGVAARYEPASRGRWIRLPHMRGAMARPWTRGGFRRVRTRADAPALRARHPPAAGADARQRPAADPARAGPDDGPPGTPILMYGDEIGMGEDLSLPGRLALRNPVQWSPRRAGGFSNASNLYRPARPAGPYGYRTVNVLD